MIDIILDKQVINRDSKNDCSYIKMLSLFSGIGAFEKALTRLEIPYKLVGFSEIDKYAIKSYCAIHNVDESLNLGDISKVNLNSIPDCDLITYGFPCTDISIAGKQQGIIEGETRSGLLYEALKIIKHKKPKYAIAENVKNLIGKKFINDFNSLLEELDSYGYNNYVPVNEKGKFACLNAKNFGIPQNRERVFLVSIRKDIDTLDFQFPKGFELKLRLKDILEDNVADKYYVKSERTKFLIEKLNEKSLLEIGKRICCDSTINEPDVRTISNCITSRYDSGIQNRKKIGLAVVEPVRIGGIYDNDTFRYQAGSIWDSYKLSPTLSTCQGGHSKPLILESSNVECDYLVYNNSKPIKKIICEQRYDEGLRLFKNNICGCIRTSGSGSHKNILEIESDYKSCSLRTRRYKNQPQALEIRNDSVSNSITTVKKNSMLIEESTYPNVAVRVKEATKLGYAIAIVGDSINLERYNSNSRRGRVGKGVAQTLTCSCNQATLESNFKIRSLTPLECWRLMGFDDEDFLKAKEALNKAFYNNKDRSYSQMYKMAGNSIVVNVLVELFRGLKLD